MVEENEIVDHPASGGMVLLFLVGVLALSTLVSLAILFVISLIKGIPFSDLGAGLTLDAGSNERNFGRFLILIQHLFTFILPSILVIWLIYKTEWKNAFAIKKFSRFLNPVLGAVFIVLAIPISGFLYWINQMIPLPEVLNTMEEGANSMIQAMLIADNGLEIVFNLLIIAVLPALGEELLFRGVLQRQLSSILKNHHLAILISAIIFSAFHLQFQGFLPRLFLGGMLGYLFYWTGNLWIPIIGHFAHNAFQVIAVYFSGENIKELDISAVDAPDYSQLLIFVTLTLLVGYYIYQTNRGNRLRIINS